jgi:restriction system protein
MKLQWQVTDYQSLMLPLLKIASDGAEHRISDVTRLLAKELALTVADAAEMLPSGKPTIFSNRAHWAKTYMAQPGWNLALTAVLKAP